MVRLGIFAALWVLAGIFLPLWIVAVAFAAWIAKVWTGIRTVHRLFQNVGPDEEPA